MPPVSADQAPPFDVKRGSDDVFLSARQVRWRYGNISDMSLWRWLRDEALGFPQPLRINGRRFWKVANLEAWERRTGQVAKCIGSGAFHHDQSAA